MDFSLVKEPILWFLSGVMSVVWSLIATFVAPKLLALFKKWWKPKFEKEYEKIRDRLKKVEILQNDKVQRYEQKLDAIHQQLIGVSFYLISFAIFWASSHMQLQIILIISGVFIFYLGTKSLDAGINIMSIATTASFRDREISKWEKDNKNADKKEFIEQINMRDFGIKS